MSSQRRERGVKIRKAKKRQMKKLNDFYSGLLQLQ